MAKLSFKIQWLNINITLTTAYVLKLLYPAVPIPITPRNNGVATPIAQFKAMS